MSPDRERREPAIRARGVEVHRGGRPVVNGVDLDLAHGEMLGLLGPNGAGKTTLLRALLGLEAHGGEVRVDGEALEEIPLEDRAKRLGFVPQRSRLDSPLPVRAVVAQGRFAHRASFGRGRAAEATRVDEALRKAHADGLADRPFTELSLGEQRRVLIARALCTGAKVILLDEPNAFLDVGQVLHLFELLGRLRSEGYALLVVLHDLDLASRHADRLMLLANGALRAEGPPGAVLTEAWLKEIYGVRPVPGGAMGFALAEEGGKERT